MGYTDANITTAAQNDYACLDATGGYGTPSFIVTANKTNQADQIECADDGIVAVNGTSKNTVKVFPNPFTVDLNLQYTVEEQSSVSINVEDVLGRSVYLNNLGVISQGLKTNVISLYDNLSSGIYLLKLSIGNSEFITKILKN